MATQRVLLVTIGGCLADSVWDDICRWSDARMVTTADEWSPEQWLIETRCEIDALVKKLEKSALTPPILYRSEHVDCWSMGDVFVTALVKGHPDYSRQLYTASHEIIATWVHSSERIVPDHDEPDETRWLYQRVNEAIDAWGELVDDRLVVLVRCSLGALWTDREVADSLATLPAWWTSNG